MCVCGNSTAVEVLVHVIHARFLNMLTRSVGLPTEVVVS